VKTIALAELEVAGRAPSLPLLVTLPDGELIIEQWLRVLPAKRYVARARLGRDTLLVKLFVGARAAKKAAEEAAAIEGLTAAGVLTPKLVDSGSVSSTAAWLFTDYLDGCETLSAKAQLNIGAVAGVAGVLPGGAEAAQALANFHNHDLIHRDIHPGNILFYDQRCWVIDAADTLTTTDPVLKQSNLGLFFAQLPQACWPELAQSYNTLAAIEADYDTVCAHAWRWQAKRAADLSEKSVRDCSLFSVRQSAGEFCAVWRDQQTWLQPVLDDLDAALASSVILKDGGSATVGLLQIGDRKVVIKRYNIKTLWHGLKRFWRPTRAWISWQAGIRLRVLGVCTPKPLALKEERIGPFRKRGYLVVEASDGQDLLSLFEDDENPAGAADGENKLLVKVVSEIQRLLDCMSRHRISHGDFKATNLLWDEQLCVIDLDSIRWHSNESRWQQAFAKDKARLLRNWKPASQPYQYLEKILKH